jgi:hypothetical protein
MDSPFIDVTPKTRRFVLTVLRNQSTRSSRERPNDEVPEGEHNWRYFETDFHTHAIPDYFSGCYKCGAMLKPRTGHWRSDEKARREAPPCPGEVHPDDLHEEVLP